MVKDTQKNSLATAKKLFDCVWPFCRVGASSAENYYTNTFTEGVK